MTTGAVPLADVLLGLPLLPDFHRGRLCNRQHVPSVFAQDDFKVTRHLTLNLGLRYDYFSPTVEANNRQSNFDYSTGDLITAGRNGASRGLVDMDQHNISPTHRFRMEPVRQRQERSSRRLRHLLQRPGNSHGGSLAVGLQRSIFFAPDLSAMA